jgi:hypothetical protein
MLCNKIRVLLGSSALMFFLQHGYRDGSLEEVVIRHLGAEDGHSVIAKDIRFSLCLLFSFQFPFFFLFRFF